MFLNMTSFIRHLTLCTGLVILPACGMLSSGQEASSQIIEGNSFIIKDVSIFDGESTAPAQTLYVDQGLISTPEKMSAQTDLPIIDGTGKTVLPGFFDAHVHAFDETSLKDALRFGVTTQLDMFTSTNFAQSQKETRERLEQKETSDLYSAGTLVTSEGGHGT